MHPVLSVAALVRQDPEFLYSALDATACAAFSKESRMTFANAKEPHRNSGASDSSVIW